MTAHFVPDGHIISVGQQSQAREWVAVDSTRNANNNRKSQTKVNNYLFVLFARLLNLAFCFQFSIYFQPSQSLNSSIKTVNVTCKSDICSPVSICLALFLLVAHVTSSKALHRFIALNVGYYKKCISVLKLTGYKICF